MKLRKLTINTKTQKYSILIGSNLILQLANLFRSNSIKFNKCLILIDKIFQKK